jgi:sarcosine oxidase subunit beta
MGASVAWHLARAGVSRVVLLEREAQLGTASTGRNAGGVRHQFSHEANVRLSIESIQRFEQFADVVGSPIDFHQDGYLFLLSRDEDLRTFERAIAMQRRLGIDVERLDPAAARALAPGLDVDGIIAATFCARDGICDPNGVTMGFASGAQRMGAAIARGVEVTGVRIEGDRVTGVDTDGGAIDTPVLVNATGAWAASIGAMAGVTLPIAPLRRHIFIAAPPSGGWAHGGTNGAAAAPASRVMVIDFDTTFYFHREGANLLFGMGDPDERPGFDISVDWRLLEKIAPVMARRLPALADAAISHAWAGLYEMTPDAMPIIGPSGVDGFFTIAGFSGHGFQHAPAAGRILADLITRRAPDFDLAPFAFERFGSGSQFREINVI